MELTLSLPLSSAPTNSAIANLWRSGAIPLNRTTRSRKNNNKLRSNNSSGRGRSGAPPLKVFCGIEDLIGGDLLGFDLKQWEEDVEKHGALAFYAPHEGGYEGRYATRLRGQGYHFLDLTARGLGDVEAYLSKIHGIRPAHLGKQKTVCWYYPPEIDYRLSLLPENSKGLVLWLIEARVLSKSELQYLALLPTIQPKVKVIAECGTWRKVRWKPLREIAGLDSPTVAGATN